MAYTFDQIFAADPSNPGNVAANGVVTIFAPGDVTQTPLSIMDTAGNPLANPVTVNANGYGDAFSHAALDRVAWAGGGFSGFFTSYEGIKNEAVAAASNAAEGAAAELSARIEAGEFKGRDGSNVIPTSAAIAAEIETPGTAANFALGDTTAGFVDAADLQRRGLNAASYALPGSGADRTAELQALMNAAAEVIDANGPRSHSGAFGPVMRLVEIPAGVWEVSAQIVIPSRVSIHMHPNTVIRARTAIAGAVLTTGTERWDQQFVMGGTIDCNQLATEGFRLRFGSTSRVESLNIQDYTTTGVYIGEAGLGGSSFEITLTDVRPVRRQGLTPPPGSIGVHIDNASDCNFVRVNPVGPQTCFRIQGGNHKFDKCHGWGYSGAEPDVVFDDRGGAYITYNQCAADSPKVAGWHLEGGYSSLNQCTVLIGSWQADNTVVGVRLGASAAHMRANNCRFQGQSATVRLKADFEGVNETWKATSTITGQGTFFSVKALASNHFPAYRNAGQLAEKAIFFPGQMALGDQPMPIFWTVPVQVDSIVIRAGSGSGTQFQIWKGGTQLTPTFNLGDAPTLGSPFGSGNPVLVGTVEGLYLKVVTAGTGSNFLVNFKARTT